MTHDDIILSVVSMMAADGTVARSEMHFLHNLCKQLGISSQDVLKNALQRVRQGQARIALPDSQTDRRLLFDILLQAAAADGEIVPQERKFLDALAKKMGIPQETMEQFIQAALKKKQAVSPGPPMPQKEIAVEADAAVDPTTGDRRFDVMFHGKIASGYTPEQVTRNLVSMFSVPPELIKHAFAGSPLLIKDQVDYHIALQYKKAFEQSGALCDIKAFKGRSEPPGNVRAETPGTSESVQSPSVEPPLTTSTPGVLNLRCSCGKILEIPETLKGKRGACPNCGAVLDIPDDIEAVPVLQVAQKQQNAFSPQELFEHVIDSVVGISHEEGQGSGVFLDAEGVVATNRHVVGTTREVTVRLNDSSECPGKVIASYRTIDLAFVKIDRSTPASYASPLTDSSLKVGQTVYAIGHPMGLQNTLTKGIVSALGRKVGGAQYVQTDAPINPGNSGGPLFEERAKLVGINTLILRETQGLGFAIPIDAVLERYTMLKKDLPELLTKHYCGVCGSLSATSRYCERCGAGIKQEEASVSFKKTKSGPRRISAAGQRAPGKKAKRTASSKKADDTGCRVCHTAINTSDKYCPKCGVTLQ